MNDKSLTNPINYLWLKKPLNTNMSKLTTSYNLFVTQQWSFHAEILLIFEEALNTSNVFLNDFISMAHRLNSIFYLLSVWPEYISKHILLFVRLAWP